MAGLVVLRAGPGMGVEAEVGVEGSFTAGQALRSQVALNAEAEGGAEASLTGGRAHRRQITDPAPDVKAGALFYAASDAAGDATEAFRAAADALAVAVRALEAAAGLGAKNATTAAATAIAAAVAAADTALKAANEAAADAETKGTAHMLAVENAIYTFERLAGRVAAYKAFFQRAPQAAAESDAAVAVAFFKEAAEDATTFRNIFEYVIAVAGKAAISLDSWHCERVRHVRCISL